MATCNELGFREVSYISEHKYNVSLYIKGGQVLAWVTSEVIRGSGRLISSHGQPATLPPLSAEQKSFLTQWIEQHCEERDGLFQLVQVA